MSNLDAHSNLYMTGEMAKLCGVTVRTVQYYDSRDILVPSEFSEGGRRLYSEEDLRKLKVICFLRNIDLPINSIAELFADKNSEDVITLLLQQQRNALQEEIKERQTKLQTLETLAKEIKAIEHFSVESISDIAYKMENRKKLQKVRTVLLTVGIPIDILEIATLVLWIVKGIWWPFVGWLVVDVLFGIWVSRYYFKRVAYICPQCHTVFKPGFKEAFFAKHTPSLRKLTCTQCGYHGFCIETYGDALMENGKAKEDKTDNAK